MLFSQHNFVKFKILHEAQRKIYQMETCCLLGLSHSCLVVVYLNYFIKNNQRFFFGKKEHEKPHWKYVEKGYFAGIAMVQHLVAVTILTKDINNFPIIIYQMTCRTFDIKRCKKLRTKERI